MEQKVIQDMVTAITPELWMLFMRMIMTVVCTLVVYQLLKNVAAYIVLRFDKEFGKNIKVMYDGQIATVIDINMRRLTLQLKNGNEVLIPIIKVGQLSWELIRNGNGGK
jgi:hypothetical protein